METKTFNMSEVVKALKDEDLDLLMEKVRAEKAKRNDKDMDRRWANITKAIKEYLEVDDIQIDWNDDYASIFAPQELDLSSRGIIKLPPTE